MAIVNDSRSIIPELGPNANGQAVYAYSQALIGQITTGVILYRVETINANIGGIVAINTNPGAVGVVFTVLRPATAPFSAEISQIINTFIQQNTFLQDVLY